MSAVRDNMFRFGAGPELRFHIDTTSSGEVRIRVAQSRGGRGFEAGASETMRSTTRSSPPSAGKPWESRRAPRNQGARAEQPGRWHNERWSRDSWKVPPPRSGKTTSRTSVQSSSAKVAHQAYRWLIWALGAPIEMSMPFKDGDWASIEQLAQCMNENNPQLGISDGLGLLAFLRDTDSMAGLEVSKDEQFLRKIPSIPEGDNDIFENPG